MIKARIWCKNCNHTGNVKSLSTNCKKCKSDKVLFYTMKGDDLIEFPDDVLKLYNYYKGKGHEVTSDMCFHIWEQHSEDVHANWLMMDGLEDEDGENVETIFPEFDKAFEDYVPYDAPLPTTELVKKVRAWNKKYFK